MANIITMDIPSITMQFPYEYKNYYEFNGQFYTQEFPKAWLADEPQNPCNSCLKQASYNGVRIGYCTNCAIRLQKGGGGFVLGVERAPAHPESASNTYLKGVVINTVGDKERFWDTEKIYMEEYAKWLEESLAEEEREAKRYGTEYPFDYKAEYSYGSNYDGGYDSH